jgi:hypothetical protein
MLTNPLFLWGAASVQTSRTPIDASGILIASVRSPLVALAKGGV